MEQRNNLAGQLEHKTLEFDRISLRYRKARAARTSGTAEPDDPAADIDELTARLSKVTSREIAMQAKILRLEAELEQQKVMAFQARAQSDKDRMQTEQRALDIATKHNQALLDAQLKDIDVSLLTSRAEMMKSQVSLCASLAARC